MTPLQAFSLFVLGFTCGYLLTGFGELRALRAKRALEAKVALLESELKAHRESYYAQWSSRSTVADRTWSTTWKMPEETHTERPHDNGFSHMSTEALTIIYKSYLRNGATPEPELMDVLRRRGIIPV